MQDFRNVKASNENQRLSGVPHSLAAAISVAAVSSLGVSALRQNVSFLVYSSREIQLVASLVRA